MLQHCFTVQLSSQLIWSGLIAVPLSFVRQRVMVRIHLQLHHSSYSDLVYMGFTSHPNSRTKYQRVICQSLVEKASYVLIPVK